jgi:C-terminal processing protease CtpA/Prc
MDYNERSIAEKMGIGAYFQKEADGKLTVKSMLTGSPSEKCGKIQVWRSQTLACVQSKL